MSWEDTDRIDHIRLKHTEKKLYRMQKVVPNLVMGKNLGCVDFTKRVRVSIPKTMRLQGRHTDIFVHTVCNKGMC